MAGVRYKSRIIVLACIVFVVFGGIAARLAVLHLRPAEWIVEPIRDGRKYEFEPLGARGRIVDRHNRILAMNDSTDVCHIGVDPKFIHEYGDAEQTCRVLCSEFEIPKDELRRKLSRIDVEYRMIKGYVPRRMLRKFSRKGRDWVYHPDSETDDDQSPIVLPGLVIDEVTVRKYPHGPLMAHVLGFVNREGEGCAGIELRMNEHLKGRKGRRVSKRDGRAREIYSAREVDIPPEDGATVVLTLDQQLQYETEQAVERVRREYHAKAVWAIVQHVRTGEILAMASSPTYDPNQYGKAPAEWRRNRAISYNYEPGSTMKAAVIASALEHDIVQESDMIDCENGYWSYGGSALRDSHGEGVISVADVIQKSSNIGTAKIALKMGNQMLYDSLKAFHFGSRLGVDVPGEEGGIFYSPKNWSKISVTRIGMGHEIGATAMQVLSMMSTIAYNGVQMRPMLVKQVVAADGTVLEEFEPEQIGTPIGPSTARRMQQLLARVTEDGGTGTKAVVEGYRVAGKTGTAQKIRPSAEGGGYYEKNFISSFAGFLPVDNPEIAIIVVADDPGTYTDSGRKIGYYGGTVCAPAFKEIAEFAVRYLRIAPEGKRIYMVRPEE